MDLALHTAKEWISWATSPKDNTNVFNLRAARLFREIYQRYRNAANCAYLSSIGASLKDHGDPFLRLAIQNGRLEKSESGLYVHHMREEFRREEFGDSRWGNHFWREARRPFDPEEFKISYFQSDAEKAPYKIEFKDGIAYQNDRPAHGKGIIVQNDIGEIFFLINPSKAVHAHSSALAGAPAAFGGHAAFTDGIIQYLDNATGHYNMSTALYFQFIGFLSLHIPIETCRKVQLKVWTHQGHDHEAREGDIVSLIIKKSRR